MYEIDFSASARDDLKELRKFDQAGVLKGIETQLPHEATVETRNRKRLRSNKVAEWELRMGRFRVLYNVDHNIKIVHIEAIGFKIGNELYIRGERRKL